ncbi:MAG: HD domain-containing protein, partial [Fidelibacterota bacterium]
TVNECIDKSLNDLDFKTSVIEARPIYCDFSLLSEFNKSIEGSIISQKVDDFVLAKIDEIRKRQEKYGNSTQLLEPNIKESRGGLRDIHTLFWLFRGTGIIKDLKIDADETLSIKFLQFLKDRGEIDSFQYNDLLSSFDFLLKVRHEVQFLKGSKSDILDLELQKRIAYNLGYKENNKADVSAFMKDYYKRSKVVNSLNEILEEKFTARYERNFSFGAVAEKIDNNLYIDLGILSFRGPEKIFRSNPKLIFKVFLYMKKYKLKISRKLRNLLKKNTYLIDEDFRRDEAVGKLFLKIFEDEEYLDCVLREMMNSGVLTAYIPEFDPLFCYAQDSYYHFFTVDEHTFVALKKIEELSSKKEFQGVLAPLKKINRDTGNKRNLLLAIFFHDSGKPYGGKHVEKSVEIARKVLGRISEKREFDQVFFLVKNHLSMEQMAFRRDCHRYESIVQFARMVKNRDNLKKLYLLSFADLNAVNPDVWTDWKGLLLWELFFRTDRYLRGEPVDAAQTESRRAHIIKKLLNIGFSEVEIRNHLERNEIEYLYAFDEKQIGRHLKMISNLKQTNAVVDKVRRKNYTDLTVFTFDKPFLLSEICGVFAANDINIFEARIFTSSDGKVIDNFRVVNAIDSGPLSSERIRDFESDLSDVLSSLKDIEELFQLHKRKWKWRLKHGGDIKSHVLFDNFGGYTIIDVFGKDYVGMLYKITKTLSSMGLNICSARVATREDGIVDSFYVLDSDGKKITDENRQGKIMEEVLKVLN